MLPVILSVDDEEDILELISISLQGKYHLLTATSAKAALQILTTESVQLVVSDVLIPDMDGFELCREIKSNIELSHIPVILLTAKNTLQAKIEGLEYGADNYMEKPFSPRHLIAQIDSLISNRNRVREYFTHSPLAHLKSVANTRTDEEFLGRLTETVQINLGNTSLDIEIVCGMLNMSRATLYRKIKSITHLSPHELINLIRLKKAAELMTTNDYKIYEVAQMTGYTSPSHFARSFHKQFSMTPTEFIQSKRDDIEHPSPNKT